MKRKTQLFLESMNSFLNEKINKDNIKINKALANPNLGKNKERIKAAGYDLEQDSDGKVYAIRNSKTGKLADPYAYSKEKRRKVDFKGQLDSTRPVMATRIAHQSDVAEDKIPKSAKIGSDKLDREGWSIYNRDDVESYSPENYRDAKKSTSDNINNYKKAIKIRDDEKRYADRGRKSLDYYEKNVKDNQQDLEYLNKYIANADKKSSDAEAQRKAIIDKIKQKRVNKESSMNEDSNLTEARSNKEANEKVAPRTQLPTWPVKYKNGVHSNAINVGGRKENLMFDDLSNGKSSIQRYKDSKEQADIARNRASEFDKKAKDIAKEEINKLKNKKIKNSDLSESSKYNTKSKEDYENEREYEAALNDDMAIIANTFEDLEYKVNIDTTVEILKSRLDEIMNDIRKNMNI